MNDYILDLFKSVKTQYNLEDESMIIIKENNLFLLKQNKIVKKYIVSTAKNGYGNLENSNKTPLGLHIVKEKHGDNLAKGEVLISRKSVGQIKNIAQESQELQSCVVTRILWLHGLEKENQSTYNRYIYIHGTLNEFALGSQNTQGCITMSNDGIVELYDEVHKGIKVYIKK